MWLGVLVGCREAGVFAGGENRNYAFISNVRSTTGYMHSTTPYHPRGVSTFLTAEEKNKQVGEKHRDPLRTKQRKNRGPIVRMRESRQAEQKQTRESSMSRVFVGGGERSQWKFYGSKVPKSGSGESGSVGLSSSLSAGFSKLRAVECPKPVALRNSRLGLKFLGSVMKPGLRRSPVLERRSWERCESRRGHSCR